MTLFPSPDYRILTSQEYESFEIFLAKEGLEQFSEWGSGTTELRQPIVVAWDDLRIVGCGRLYRTWLHPMRWRIAIHVTPRERRQGIGSSLLAKLCHQLAGDVDHELQASASAANASAIGFLEAAGFKLLMTTRIGVLSSETEFEDIMGAVLPGDIRIATLAQDPYLLKSTAHLHERVYRDLHRWNPPIQLSLNEKIELFLDSTELMPEHQFIALRHEIPIGIASLRRLSVANTCDFGWIGVVDVPDHLAIQVHEALWGHCLTAARTSNMAIHVEIDHADRLSTHLSGALPICWEPDWLTYHRKQHSSDSK